MARKKKHGWLDEIYKLIIVIPSLCNIIAYGLDIVANEIRKLLDKFLSLLAIFITVAIIGMTSWLCVCGIIFYSLISMPLGIVPSLLIVLAINLFLLMLFFIAFNRMKRNIKVDIPFNTN